MIRVWLLSARLFGTHIELKIDSNKACFFNKIFYLESCVDFLPKNVKQLKVDSKFSNGKKYLRSLGFI